VTLSRVEQINGSLQYIVYEYWPETTD